MKILEAAVANRSREGQGIPVKRIAGILKRTISGSPPTHTIRSPLQSTEREDGEESRYRSRPTNRECGRVRRARAEPRRLAPPFGALLDRAALADRAAHSPSRATWLMRVKTTSRPRVRRMRLACVTTIPPDAFAARGRGRGCRHRDPLDPVRGRGARHVPRRSRRRLARSVSEGSSNERRHPRFPMRTRSGAPHSTCEASTRWSGTRGRRRRVGDGRLARRGRGSATLTRSEFRSDLERAVSAQEFLVAGATEGAVRLLAATDLRGLTFHTIIILGLVEGQFPERARGDWIAPSTSVTT